jgi:anti-sigma factor RsiW
MRTFEERPDAIDSASLDRLVDGDLPENERRELFLRLENDPEGWRRCALAFLEDQAWRKALTPAVHAESALDASSSVAMPAKVRRAKDWLVRGSLAASLMGLTFAAGFAARGLATVDHPVEVAKSETPASTSTSAAPQPDQIREVGSLELVDSSAGESPPRRFPIRSGPGLDEKWLLSQPSSVPDYLRARWERQGYRLAERRKLVSVELGDGRHVSIPVDEVEVDYVGQQPL